jgi:hypothetical protein
MRTNYETPHCATSFILWEENQSIENLFLPERVKRELLFDPQAGTTNRLCKFIKIVRAFFVDSPSGLTAFGQEAWGRFFGMYRVFANLRTAWPFCPCAPETFPPSAENKESRVSVIIPRIIVTLLEKTHHHSRCSKVSPLRLLIHLLISSIFDNSD